MKQIYDRKSSTMFEKHGKIYNYSEKLELLSEKNRRPQFFKINKFLKEKKKLYKLLTIANVII